jgi:N-acetylneuraminic acid mutarotase
MLVYNAQTQTWDTAGVAPFSHVTVPAVTWNRLHVIPSGEIRPGVRSPAVWAVDPAP